MTGHKVIKGNNYTAAHDLFPNKMYNLQVNSQFPGIWDPTMMTFIVCQC